MDMTFLEDLGVLWNENFKADYLSGDAEAIAYIADLREKYPTLGHRIDSAMEINSLEKTA